MNKNKNKINLIWIAIIFLAIGIVMGFLVSLNTSKTGNAMKAISNSKVGTKINVTDNFSIEKTKDGVVTTYIQRYEDEKGNIVTEKSSTLMTTDDIQFTCNSSCRGDDGTCQPMGCDAYLGYNGLSCSVFTCTNDNIIPRCNGSCGANKSSSISIPTN